MYDDPDKQAAYRRIQDFSTEQLIWRVMYAVNAFQDSPRSGKSCKGSASRPPPGY